jgi:hypothetical protein
LPDPYLNLKLKSVNLNPPFLTNVSAHSLSIADPDPKGAGEVRVREGEKRKKRATQS